MDKEKRNEAFEQLEEEGRIIEVRISGIRYSLYVLRDDLELLQEAKNDVSSRRLEFLAPLDPLLWDRDLIKAVFGFDYSWEIYLPKEKRKYGYYVLPVLYGDRFIGRIEPVLKDGRLIVKGFWPEKGVRRTKKLQKALERTLKNFARFNDVVLDAEHPFQIEDL
jgi:uncharacterized protein YcaQ